MVRNAAERSKARAPAFAHLDELTLLRNIDGCHVAF